MPQQEIKEKSFADITASCAKVISYFHLQNGISPIKRLYVKNSSDTDREGLRIKISSEPKFILPFEMTGVKIPRRTTAKFDADVSLSPLYMVALDRRESGEIVLEVFDENDALVASQRFPVELLAFNECDFSEDPGSLAAFVRRTAELNKLMNLAARKLQGWELSSCTGYSGTRNNVRNHFAACYSVLADQKFTRAEAKTDAGYTYVSDHRDTLITGAATPLELALILAAMVEANGQNAVISLIDGKWYAGCFLVSECLPNTISDDADLLRRKSERGVGDVSLVCVNDIFGGISFEKAEKSAQALLKKGADAEFIVDIKRARIMHIFPLPERVKGENGYDLRQSKDYYTDLAPKQLKEYGGDIGGEKEISRVTQWERRLLDMDMRNALLNFKVSQTVVKLLVPSIEDFVENMADIRSYTVECKPKETLESLDKLSNGFDRGTFLKPFADYILYEYRNRRLRTVFDQREHESALLRLFRKEKSIQEETGTLTLYLAAGFLKWKEADLADDKYAPLFLYPVTISKKGIAAPVYTVEVNTDDLRVNSTLLEFLYQEFDLDMRGLASADLSTPQGVLSVLARIKRETVRFKGWDFIGNVFLASLSFANYLLWHDVKYKSDRFRAHPIVRSLINNRLELPEGAFDLSDRSSDEAYIGEERMYLPISADSSQYSAIYDSLSKSFVLHGPPGTGKSQTITNIIANNIVRGRRVLFVAEKMAALSVVHRRLQNIGLGDFCLELHSNKANKTQVLNHIISTLSLAESTTEQELSEKAAEIAVPLEKLQKELDAMHRKRYLGFSRLSGDPGLLRQRERARLPEHRQPLLREADRELLQQLPRRADRALPARQGVRRHREVPLPSHRRFHLRRQVARRRRERPGHLSDGAQTSAPICQRALSPLQHAHGVPHRGRNSALFTTSASCWGWNACAPSSPHCDKKRAETGASVQSVAGDAKGLLDSFREALARHRMLTAEYVSKYGAYPSDIPMSDLEAAVKTESPSRAVKKLIPSSVEKKDRKFYLEFLAKCESNRLTLMRRRDELAAVFGMSVPELAGVEDRAEKMTELYSCAAKLYADFDAGLFNESCIELTRYGIHRFIPFFIAAYDNCERAGEAFAEVFRTGGFLGGDDLGARVEYVTNVQKNLDFIPSWCRYQEMVEHCRKSGFDFILEPLDAGAISAADILSCFKKCVYYNFVKSELYLDDVLCQFSGLTLEEAAAKFKNPDGGIRTPHPPGALPQTRALPPPSRDYGRPQPRARHPHARGKDGDEGHHPPRTVRADPERPESVLPVHADVADLGVAVPRHRHGEVRPRHLRRGVPGAHLQSRREHRARQERHHRRRPQAAPAHHILQLGLQGRRAL